MTILRASTSRSKYDPGRVGWLERGMYEALKLVYGEYPPLAALNYIWGTRIARGSIVPNVCSARARMMEVESGPEDLGRWVEERRDVLADYRSGFGGEPPAISGVAVMTDTDDTGESATAHYGDIAFGTGPDDPPPLKRA